MKIPGNHSPDTDTDVLMGVRQCEPKWMLCSDGPGSQMRNTDLGETIEL